MHKTLSLLIIALLSLPGKSLAQDEQKVAQNLLSRWDQITQDIRDARRQLQNLQVDYSGAEEPAKRKAIAKQFGELTAATHERAVAFTNEVAAFIEKHPKNTAIRQRRLEDQIFDRLDPAKKSADAEALYRLNGDGAYLHAAAEHADRAYDFERSAKLWQEASERAETRKVAEALAKAYMNVNEFAKATAAYERAAELARADRDFKNVERTAKAVAEYVEGWKREQKLREQAKQKDDLPRAEIVTTRGTILVELFEDEAPNTVANFIQLAEQGKYKNLLFHRNMAYFMCQTGCPKGDGSGGPGYYVKDEYGLPNARLHFRGSLSMANTGQPNTNGSQFFVSNVNNWQLNGRHTVFGRVLDGMEVIEVQPLDPTNKAEQFGLLDVRIIRKRDHEYKVETLPVPDNPTFPAFGR